MSKQSDRFQTTSDRYAQFRPQYPDSIVRRIAAQIVEAPVDSALPVLDVGSGTGIFTRQISAALPAATPVIGIEPSEHMREQAMMQPSPSSVSYRDGDAEHLPVKDGSARAVVAATAAHWFDRPAFYREAARVLPPGGILAIVEYVRDENSPAARAVIDFLAQHGEARAYARPAYTAELGALAGFIGMEEIRELVTLLLSPPEFAGLALSSSHARKIVEDIGEVEASAQLELIARDLVGDDGMVPFGYVFQAFTTRRA
ncbi:class I SAM-dependent methyltransferase [Brucella intermedia]|uniref:class I SAM-dependent methyltransferase n=1 Tax=Brucella intermedia TaxID=94625 RepID=UPI00224A99FF|nr:class I SAM-dependent methyltransferase [Brucella intermedia]